MSEVGETDEIAEDNNINMLEVDNDDFEIHYDKKQGLYTPYDDKEMMTKIIIKTWIMSS